MTTWILTIGSSDVLLDINLKLWNTLEREAKTQNRDLLHFTAVSVEHGGKRLLSLPPRAVGLAYAKQLGQYSSSLKFPRLDALFQKIEQCHQLPKQVVVLLTDQSHLFDLAKRKQDSPYWQDTCELEPILQFYLKQKLPKANQIYRTVQPEPDMPGLDHWDNTLSLIQPILADIPHNPRKTVYVSHQAGTPALSSAVQFVSLTKFGANVQFLVSNEFQEDSSELIPSSTYLQGIRLQEAKRLLKRYDYAGVQEILQEDLKTLRHPIAERVDHLLKAAVLWNQAQFQEFSNLLGAQAKARTQEWWWLGYESIYLSVVRFEQGNTVEALFHSFRAAEGTISNWAKQYYKDDIEDKDGLPVAILVPNSRLPAYLLEKINSEKEDTPGRFKLYGERLFKLFRETCPEAQNNEDVKVVWGKAIDRRNKQFHRLLGLDEKSLFQCWGMNSPKSWKERILRCLNFISDQNFTSIENASLMGEIHQELWDTIASKLPTLSIIDQT